MRRLRAALDDLRSEVAALARAMGDPRTPRHARLIAGLTVGLALSPIDPIPDFVPVLGYLDDALFIPAGVYLFRRAVPEEVLADAREAADPDAGTAAADPGAGTAGWLVAALVVAAWAVAAYALVRVALGAP